MGRRLRRRFGADILDELAKARILALPHRTVQTHRLPAHVEHAAGLLDGDAGGLRKFLNRRFPAEFVQQFLGSCP